MVRGALILHSETGNDVYDYTFANREKVRYCIAGQDTAGFIIKDLWENCEQVNNIKNIPDDNNASGDRLYSDIKMPKYDYKWFVKPSIRVDSNYAKNNPQDTVCKLFINRFDGQQLDSVVITCDNFLIHHGLERYYNGRYIEMFFNVRYSGDTMPYAFSVKARDLIIGRTTNPDNIAESQIDFRIKWGGES
jgi:hypothetical protein